MALPNCLSRKSCTRTCSGCPAGCHSRPPFLKSPTSSFFLAVDGDRRLAPLLEGACLLIDGGELGVTIRVVRALFRCAGALQTVVERVQQVRHGLMADLVSLTYQLGRQLAGALAGPAQGRHGVSTGGGFHQRLQVV